MELNKLINKIHKLIEAKEIKTISQPSMAKRIGVQPRTYTEYSRGTNQPLGMKALLNMLNELEDDEIVKVIRLWKETNNDKTSQDKHILEESYS
ncbi:XRE family transcriptional regulator [Aliarcobacter butzleri]|uniref:XRE family transcriptional regulator n=1 Tax=Aliarcobacter butzleri TaxID=28197 RepID=UPI00102DB430|nr:XRE family transcriptional regulator [Aliarcobacter butzleri]RZV16506.1 XRE family transcriptional regulator [Aliarcobacter butzleri]